jgi:alpha-L-fucosidase
METYAFIHFGLNTFNDMEWGYGDTDPKTFNPVHLDAEQWAKTFAEAGMKGVILTAKHHDGFCLWPTELTDYCIRNASYKDGKGDVVGELAAACRKYGLKFGVYLSPWDRNSADYGTPAYVTYYHAQLRELLTRYGDIFEVWFDGANGGDGYYGGARERRNIDRRTYYDFPKAWAMVEELQPEAICFSDGGPGCRWVGNERGVAGTTNWAFLRAAEVYPGYPNADELNIGHPDGDTWIPAECDVSIRPGWFYHESEDDKVKTADDLVELYYKSVGRGGNFLLNFPVNKEGLISKTDSLNAVTFHQRITQELSDNLLENAKVEASDVRGRTFAATKVNDADFETYWATPDEVTAGTLTFTFKEPQAVSKLLLQEYIPLGQRVKSFNVEILQDDKWLPVDVGEETTTIGYKRIVRFPQVTVDALRVNFLEARGPLCISEVGAYK